MPIKKSSSGGSRRHGCIKCKNRQPGSHLRRALTCTGPSSVAPRASSRLHMSRWPILAAKMSGVMVQARRVCMYMPTLVRAVILGSPPLAAHCPRPRLSH